MVRLHCVAEALPPPPVVYQEYTDLSLRALAMPRAVSAQNGSKSALRVR